MHGRDAVLADEAGVQARQGGVAELTRALQASRADTLGTFACYETALGPDLTVPYRTSLNPPLWEVGHIGWFQEFWLARNPQRVRGVQADPEVPRAPGVRAEADALYNSSRVAHASRWQLALPDAAATRRDLAAQLESTLDLLAGMPVGAGAIDDDSLYFHRLALFHEDMHHEAALYMARSLGIRIDDPRWTVPRLELPRRSLDFAPSAWTLGSTGAGFAFDNELPAQVGELPACSIDSRVLTWRDWLPFAESGAYEQLRWWTEAGQAWLAQTGARAPRYLRRDGTQWLQHRHGAWQALDPDQPAEHLSLPEARAWCRWAGRRLPSEAEWERAACTRPQDFSWGHVWEWTASAFAPFPGFVAHPYRDYSQPWFDGRPVLRGASYLTQPRLRHARYRNYFTADRNDIVAGMRTCALSGSA